MVSEYDDIVPGESIGPFRLGMTREQIDELDIRPRIELQGGTGTHYPLVEIDEEAIRSRAYSHPCPGVNVYYDPSGRCHRLGAILRYDPSPPVFILCGHVANGLSEREVTSILHSISSDVKSVYGSVCSLSAGIRAIKWEASDDHIMCIDVMPKREGGP